LPLLAVLNKSSVTTRDRASSNVSQAGGAIEDKRGSRHAVRRGGPPRRVEKKGYHAKSHFVFQNGNDVVLREARNGVGVPLELWRVDCRKTASNVKSQHAPFSSSLLPDRPWCRDYRRVRLDGV
jgi:hypothetical protein